MEEKEKKFTIKDSIIFLIIAIIIIVAARSCGSKYKKEIQWADTKPLVVAVEVDDYEGDKIKEGRYNVYVDHVASGKTAGVYDIYIEDHNVFNKSDLGKPIGTIGGTTQENGSITLHKGDYVVIYPIDVYYEPSGILTMEWIKPL